MYTNRPCCLCVKHVKYDLAEIVLIINLCLRKHAWQVADCHEKTHNGASTHTKIFLLLNCSKNYSHFTIFFPVGIFHR